MKNPDTAVPASEADFRITRTFNAPRALVYKTMTETEHLQHWWGPQGCRITVAKHEPRPGGMFHYCMHFPGGADMWGRFVYRALTPSERIVFVNGFSDPEGNAQPNPMSPDWPMEVLNTTTLTEAGGKTVLTLVSQPINATELERANFLAGHASMQGGYGGMYDHYQQYLASIQTKENEMASDTDVADRELVLSRLLNAPPALVFDTWSDPAHVSKWWGPRGFTTTTHEMAFKVGGRWRFTMHGPDGTDYRNLVLYTEIVRPQRICYDHGDDESETGPVRDFKVRVTFEGRGGTTLLTLRMLVENARQLEAMKQFGAVEGGTQTLDRLEQFLAGKLG